MDEPAGRAKGMRRNQLDNLSMSFLVAAVVAIIFSGWIFTESGYHFYWAKGMTESQVIKRYGEPEWREKGIHDGANYLRYYTGFLNFVDLRVQDGRVTEVEIRPDD